MKSLIYFSTEDDVRKYATENGYAKSVIDCMIQHANDDLDYYNQFSKIEGCELAYVMDGDDLYRCFKWKGVMMRACYDFDNNTHKLRLCDETDWQGINRHHNSVSQGNIPNKIGKPTASKLDEWLTYLLDLRSREENSRDLAFARMVAKIREVKKNFPEAKNIEWQRGHWCFEKADNGLVYAVDIDKNGDIYENLVFTTYQQRYNIGVPEKAARMMRNGLRNVKPIDKDCKNPYHLEIDRYDAYISKFIGKRPF